MDTDTVVTQVVQLAPLVGAHSNFTVNLQAFKWTRADSGKQTKHTLLSVFQPETACKLNSSCFLFLLSFNSDNVY